MDVLFEALFFLSNAIKRSIFIKKKKNYSHHKSQFNNKYILKMRE